jgi:hypothetical protein
MRIPETSALQFSGTAATKSPRRRTARSRFAGSESAYLLLMDAVLPVMNGWQATNTIKSAFLNFEATNRTVIAWSGCGWWLNALSVDEALLRWWQGEGRLSSALYPQSGDS